MDDERLKNPDGRPDYFDEMLERIRDIRASEIRRRFVAGLRNFHQSYKSAVDTWAMFDNVGETPVLLELEESQ